jgi:transposase
MARKHKASRLQYGLFATPLEEMIEQDNPVRIIDVFVDALDLQGLGFHRVSDPGKGAASYDPADLLKIYFYGYFNRIRSSRCLERECQRNVEMMWLVGRQTPSYHTISTFRTLKINDKATGKEICNHRKALVAVFRRFNQILKGEGLFGESLFAVDGTKIAAQNSKKRHISEGKIARKLQRVDARIEEYMAELDQADLEQNEMEDLQPRTLALLEALADMDERRSELQNQQALLDAAKAIDPQLTQICLTDPDARMLPINNEGMMQIAYNVQSVVDDQHCLIADFSVENQKDVYLLSPMGKSVKQEFCIGNDIDLLADKGYHSGKGIHECGEAGITTYVAFPEQTYRDKPTGFQKEDFKYDAENDQYICPQGKSLKTSGTWHQKHGRQGHLQAQYQLYRCSFQVCSGCPKRNQCLSKSARRQRHGRTIERSEYEMAAQQNRERILLHREKYKRRQGIVEHPFGSIKRSWGAYYTLLKSKEKVSGEMAIVFTCYNLRRAINILGYKGLKNALGRHFSLYFASYPGFRDFFSKTAGKSTSKSTRLRCQMVAFGRAA